MGKYRRKQGDPVEAFQYTGRVPDGAAEAMKKSMVKFCAQATDGRLRLEDTRTEGYSYAGYGQWVVIDNGRYCILDPDDFAQTYEPVEDGVQRTAREVSEKLNAAYMEKLPYLVKASRVIHDYLVNTDKKPLKLIGMLTDLGTVLENPPFRTMTCDDVCMGDLYRKPSEFKNGNWADNIFDYFNDLFDGLFKDISGEKPPDYTSGVVTSEGVFDA